MEEPAGRRDCRFRELRGDDLQAVARVHMAAFPSSALTRLGLDAVSRYYRWQLEGPHESVRLAAVIDSTLAGFCIAGRFQGALSGFLARNWYRLTLALLLKPWLLVDPSVRQKVAQALRSLGILTRDPRPREEMPPAGKDFGILVVAVDPRFRRRGVGRRLMDVVEHVARGRGYARMHLSVDSGNAEAVHFYEALGWEKSVADGVWTGHMYKALQPAFSGSEGDRRGD